MKQLILTNNGYREVTSDDYKELIDDIYRESFKGNYTEACIILERFIGNTIEVDDDNDINKKEVK